MAVQAHKWPTHVFFWILDTAMVNAYELCCSFYGTCKKTYPLLRFKKRLLWQLG